MGRVGFGYAKSGKGNGASTPSWLPLADGAAPKVYADFAAQNYWYNGATVADWASFLTALSGTLDGSSSRYCTNVAGTLVATTGPRFDYDPVTHVARGILLEGARTNLCLRSQEFDNASWQKARVTVSANAIAAPDGTTTADKVIEDGNTNTHSVFQGPLTTTISAIYTYSVFVKAGERTWASIVFDDSTSHRTWFNLSNGTVGTNAAGNTASIQAYPNGWYRLIITRAVDSIATYIDVSLATGDNVTSYAGDNASGLYAWGAVLELGAFASSYIPTTSGSVTRAADSLLFTPISGWFNAATGTMFAKLKENGLNTSAHWSFNDNTAGNELKAYEDPSSKLFIRAGAATSADFAAGSNQTVVAGTSFKIASAFASNDAAHVKDNGTAGTDASVTIPAVDRLILGAGVAGIGAYFGTIEQFGYWTIRVSNAGLQTLTT